MSDDSQRVHLRLADWIMIGLLSVIIAVVLLAILCRYVLNYSLAWSDELVRYLFAWFTLLGAAIVFRDRLHIRVEFFVGLLPESIRVSLGKASLLLVVGFNLVLVGLGVSWAIETQGTLTPALGMPLNIVFYGAVPASSSLAVCYGVFRNRDDNYIELADETEHSAIKGD